MNNRINPLNRRLKANHYPKLTRKSVTLTALDDPAHLNETVEAFARDYGSRGGVQERLIQMAAHLYFRLQRETLIESASVDDELGAVTGRPHDPPGPLPPEILLSRASRALIEGSPFTRTTCYKQHMLHTQLHRLLKLLSSTDK